MNKERTKTVENIFWITFEICTENLTFLKLEKRFIINREVKTNVSFAIKSLFIILFIGITNFLVGEV